MHWPVEALRDRYLTPFGGCSTDLYPWQVGVNAAALRENTHLAAGVRVLVSLDEGAPRSVIARAVYEVVPLDATTAPEAATLSPDGEAVFSSFELDGDARGRSVLNVLRSGASVVLNAAASRFGTTF